MLGNKDIDCGDQEDTGIQVEEEISGNVVKVGRKSNKLIVIVLTLGTQ